MSTSYTSMLAAFYETNYTPALDGVGALWMLLKVLSQFDSSSASSGALNQFDDARRKIEAAIPNDSQARRDVLAMLVEASDKVQRGQSMIYHEPRYRLNYQDLESFVADTYGFELDYLQASGVVSGESKQYAIDGRFPTTSWRQRAQAVREGQRTHHVGLILNVLAADGKIPKGFYTVTTQGVPCTS